MDNILYLLMFSGAVERNIKRFPVLCTARIDEVVITVVTL